MSNVAAQLVGSRALVELFHGRMMALAATGQLPCSAIELYNTLAGQQTAAEAKVIAAAKAADIPVPEAAPRALAVFGACSPGATEAPLSLASKAAGTRRLVAEKQRAAQMAQTIQQRTTGDPAFAALVRANAGMPPEALCTLGGALWDTSSATALAGVAVSDPTPQAVALLAQHIQAATKTVNAIVEARGGAPDENTGSRWWWWALGGLGALGAIGGLVWYSRWPQREMIYNDSGSPYMGPDVETEEDAEDLSDADDSGAKVDARIGGPRRRRRSRRRRQRRHEPSA